MMKLFAAFVLSFCLLQLHAQQKISLQEVAKHEGDSVMICGKVYGGKYLANAKNQPTFLDMGGSYPNQLVTIVIWGDTRKLFSYVPEERLKDKNVCISGKISIYRDKPQIIIYSASQITEQ